MIVLYIPGKPISKKRPRFARRRKFVTTYNDQETEEGRFLWEVKRQFTGDPLGGPLEVFMWFVMPIPSGSKKKMLAMAEAEPPHIKKPDLDNLIKFAKDCLNGVAWHDDSQVSILRAQKNYGAVPLTRIEIVQIEEPIDRPPVTKPDRDGV